jgi:hypothetical protein
MVFGSAMASSVSRMSLVLSGGFSFQHSADSNRRGRVVVDVSHRLSVSDGTLSRVQRVVFEMALRIAGLNPSSKTERFSMAAPDSVRRDILIRNLRSWRELKKVKVSTN